MIRGAVFDMDGTLLDTMPLWDRAGEIYLASLGVKAQPDLGRRLFPLTVAQSAKLIKREYSLTLSVCEIVKGIDDTVMDFYLKKARLKPGTEEFLKKLKERGIALSVATVTGRECTEAALRRTGIYGLFTAVLTADDAPCGKERPDIFLLAARAMGTEPGNTLVFEDALHAVETAHAAGFVTVGVYDSFSEAAQPRLKEAADHYIRDFCGFDSFARGAGI